MKTVEFVNVGQGNCTILYNFDDKIVSVVDCGSSQTAETAGKTGS